MKKVVLLSMSLALGFSAFAQQRVAKDDFRSATASAKKVVVGKDDAAPTAAQFAPQSHSVVANRYEGDLEFASAMWTTYDLQSNGHVSNRMYQLPNGNVATTATMSHTPSQTSVPDRGTGYNFYKDGEWIFGDALYGEGPETRVESVMSGWPSIAQWGENGEILLSHGGGALNCYTREVAGEGEWQFRGSLPNYPDGYPYDEYPTWPRVTTSGDNHNIIHVAAALQHSISSDETDVRTVLFRSEDAENWTVSYGPLEELGYHIGVFSADDYILAANGHTVALLYSGDLTNSVWMFKSTDDGLTWNTTKVWEHPFENVSLETEGLDYGDTLFMPMNASMVIDNNGVVHVAMNVFAMSHLYDTDPGYYNYWIGRFFEGIMYWNDTQEPIHDTYHEEYVGTSMEEHFANPNPFHAARLWWPVPDDGGYVHILADSTKWIGFVPMYENIDFENDKFYHESDYHYRFYSCSGHPALSCDPNGNLACAFSTPCTAREGDVNGTKYYLRSIYVSYRNVDEGYWHQIEDDLFEPVFDLAYSDGMFTIAAPNTYNVGEYWFGFQADYQIGLAWGSGASQTETTQNDIYGMKVIANPEFVNVTETAAVNPMTSTRVYPNPATDVLNIEVNAAQASEMSINVYNIMGQQVMTTSVNLGMGINRPSINTSDLTSGIYFVTVKANGFENTMKFIVK